MLQDVVNGPIPTDPAEFADWRQSQVEEILRLREEVETTQRLMGRAQEELDKQRETLDRESKATRERLERETQLFEMKWRLLQEETSRLACDKEKFDREKTFYSHVRQHEETRIQVSNAEIFFIGVGSEKVLKKRYKDLLKIYHPDNVGGDTAMIQEINKEYNTLSRKLKVVGD